MSWSSLLLSALILIGPEPALRPQVDPRLSQAHAMLKADAPPEDKVRNITELLSQQPASMIHLLEEVRPGEGLNAGKALFRSSQDHRIRLAAGHALVDKWPDDDQFSSEYAAYVLRRALADGEAEFMKPATRVGHTSIGEIAYMAAGFEGLPASLFDKVADRRLIPILTRCLDAPDHLRGDDGSCIVDGPPGTPSGRNVPRQLLPIALARLKATESLPKLRQLAADHYDIHLRANSVYAVAAMGDLTDMKALADQITREAASPSRSLLMLELGKGLAQRGESRAVEYLSMEKGTSASERDSISLIYAIEQRLSSAKRLPADASHAFFAELLSFAPTRALLLGQRDQHPAFPNGYNIDSRVDIVGREITAHARRHGCDLRPPEQK